MPREPSADPEFADSTRRTTPDKPVHLEDGDDLDAFIAEHDLELVETYDVRSVPTLLLFEDGELVGRLADGFRGTEAVVEFVASRGAPPEDE